MTKRSFRAAMSMLALLALSLPALAESEAPPRPSWTKADLASGKVVKWVVEGCAAYPVIVDDPPAKLASANEPHATSEPTPPTKSPLDNK